MTGYRQAPIKYPPAKSKVSWEEREYKKGYLYRNTNQYVSKATTDVIHSPFMQGYRVADKEIRLKALLLKSRS